MSDAAALPRLSLPAAEPYYERRTKRESGLDRWGARFEGSLVAPFARLRAGGLHRIVRATKGHEATFQTLDDAGIAAELADLRIALRRREAFALSDAARAFALIRELGERYLGMRHYDVQLIGSWALLNGMIAEMATGEGKTLAVTLGAGTAALAGRPVHVITVNDYLAERDAEEMRPLYEALGLTVGTVVAGQSTEERQAAYAADIAYCTNKEVAFDYLRDRMERADKRGRVAQKVAALSGAGAAGLRLRGLHFAIVDEADSVLIDEARTPLIISGAGDAAEEAEHFETAMRLADTLHLGRHYTIHPGERRLELTARGRDRLENLGFEEGGHWRVRVIREEVVTQALSARHLFRRDEHYLVADGKVQIIDEYTGRVMPDRTWSDGLHQLIEMKEGCEPSARRTTLAKITYQRFFRRYRHLSGTTGTAASAAPELWAVYRLAIAKIPTHRPILRREMPDRVFRTADAKWAHIVGRVAELHARGVPVLVGTRSVAASEEASRRLKTRGIAHEVLNAAQDKEEAGIVEGAGARGRVTVATNMAGRGTDIRLGDGVEALGGLHVIMTERHDAARIDRQLAGRAGRQGQPGRVETYLSLDDELMADRPGLSRLAAISIRRRNQRRARALVRRAQKKVEREHSRARRALLDSDATLGDLLAFSGELE